MVHALNIFFTAFLLLMAGRAMAQSYHFEKITEQDGLSDNRVTCFMKDRRGFMWIGTANGLNRYDGHGFRIYRPGQRQWNISHEYINDVEEDTTGRLWIATWNGLNVLDPDKDSLTVFSPDEDAYRQRKNKLSSSLIWDLYTDDSNRIWIAPDVRDLCYFDPAKQEFTYLPWRAFVQATMPEKLPRYTSIQKIRRKSNDELWLGTTLGLFSYRISSQMFQYHGGDDIGDFVSLHYDSATHRVYFGQKNLYLYEEGAPQAEKITLHRDRNFIVAPQSPILLATHDGLWGIDRDAQAASRVPVINKNPFALHHEITHAVFNDRGTYWIGTAEGVRIYDHAFDRFQFIRIFPDTVRNLAGNVYHAFDHETYNQYYISSFTTNALIVLDKKTGEQKVISHLFGKPLLKCAKTFIDSRERLWLLTTDRIFLSDSDHDHFRRFPFPKENDDYIFVDMIEDADGDFWFASVRYGVYHFSPKTNTWKLLRHKPDGLFATRPTSLLSVPAHREVWIGDYSFGAFQYSLDSNTFVYHGMDATSPDLMHSSLINGVAVDHNGDVWVATTSGGVSKYVRQEKKFKTFSMKTGLRENTVEAIACDTKGNLWLAYHQGLTCMSPDGKIIRDYEKNKGLLFTGFATPISVNQHGELLTGIANGFLKFHPDSLSLSSKPFPVVITDAHQGDHEFTASNQKIFPFDKNEFTFQFAALTYTLPGRVHYFYKLDGYDHAWIDAGNNHTARYTNLNDGRYTFRVKAVDYTGGESAGMATISFTIAPPFWKRWWFILVVLVAFCSLLYFWIHSLQQKILSQQTLNKFATSLYNKNTIEEVFWDIAQNCVKLLMFEDCVVYLLHAERNVLIQKAAAGPKGGTNYKIVNPIEIPVGAGIVGTVAESGKPEIIHDTTKDPRYIIDDLRRRSEITVPIMVDGKVFGVIDSEHSKKRFYTRWHLRMLEEVAAICSAKISRYFVEDFIRSKVARDLHDDMGSTLSSIKIMSNIALERKEPALSQNYLKTIRQNAAMMQESMSDIVWAINPENDTIEKVVIRMKEFAAEILEPLEIQYKFIEQGDFNLTRMDLNTRKDFYLIFKEAVNNAAKYSQCKEVTITLTRSTDGLELTIHDNGVGFDSSTPYAGNGLKNMQHRARNIGADFRLSSRPNGGTKIHLTLASHDRGI